MQLQDTPADFLFKLWPRIEANKVRIIVGGSIVIVAAVLFSFYSWQREQKEITAGKALTRFIISPPPNATGNQLADLFLKIAGDYPGTSAGQRAWLQGAAMLFAGEKYADAQAQFQQFLDTYPNGFFTGQAALGVAACLDAQGKTDSAAGAYQRVVGISSDVTAANSAKFALAQIDEKQGKSAEALSLYEDIARYNPNSSLGVEAGLRGMELRMKLPSASLSTAPAAPSKPNN